MPRRIWNCSRPRRSAAVELFTNKLISGSDYDTAIATLHEAEATVQIKQASLDNATANLGYCKIRSPVDGIVISRAIDLGQTVASSFNTPTLFQIANDLTKMQIDSSVAEADIGGVIEGQSVDFTVDAYPDRTFHGTVTQVRNSPTTVNNVVTYDCVISVTNADYKLKPGMTANVSFIVAATRKCVDHPERRAAVSSARFRRGGNQFWRNATGQQRRQCRRHVRRPRPSRRPWARRTPGFSHRLCAFRHGWTPKLQAVQIKTGISDGISTEVISGLDEGAQVVTGMVSTGTPAARTSSPLRRLPQNALSPDLPCRPIPSSSSTDIHKVYHTGEVDVHAVRGISLEIFRANLSPSWVRAAPAKAR